MSEAYSLQAAIPSYSPVIRDRPADLASLHKQLECHVERAEQLASRAGSIADQVFGTRPESAQGVGANMQSSLASTIDRLESALNSISSNLDRL